MKRFMFLLICGLLAASITAFPQTIDVKGKVKEKTTSRADQRVDENIENGLDKLEQGIGSLFKKKQKNDEEDSEEEEEESVNENENVQTEVVDEDDGGTNSVNSKESVSDVTPQLKLTSYSKFDFIPGEKIFFYDDFSKDPVGDFPGRWNTDNSGEVVTVDGLMGKWLKIPAEGSNYFPELNLQFPENVTIEFDAVFFEETEFIFSYYSEQDFDINAYGTPGEAGSEIWIGCGIDHRFSSYTSDENNKEMEIFSSSLKGPVSPNEIAHISIWIQKSRYRMYVNEQKVFDLPKGIFNKYTYNRIRFNSSNTGTDFLIGNVRIAVGTPDTRNQLITEGKFVTRGILFDSGSDVIKPESYACIKEIANVLKENPGISVIIIGHTDSDGDEAKNLDLSKRRSSAVKKFLVSEFTIDAGRMQTDGKGESQPAMSNDTPEGKASNRRVEFIKN